MRLDQYLVFKGLAPSRAKAQELIKSEKIILKRNDQVKEKISSSFQVLEGDDVSVEEDTTLLRYVARSGLKLEGALSDLSLSVQNLSVLDVGQSTGGFTDCLLQLGASHVIGIDVGHGQLAEKIKFHKRVSYYEGVNAKELEDFWRKNQLNLVDLVVMDVSFISICNIISPINFVLSGGGHLLSLVKPQFEVTKSALNKKGIVKDVSCHLESIKSQLIQELESCGFQFKAFIESRVKGKKGNQEFFIFAEKRVTSNP